MSKPEPQVVLRTIPGFFPQPPIDPAQRGRGNRHFTRSAIATCFWRPGYRSGRRKSGKQRAAIARQVDTRRLRPLDPAGTRVRGQRCYDRFLARVVLYRACSSSRVTGLREFACSDGSIRARVSQALNDARGHAVLWKEPLRRLEGRLPQSSASLRRRAWLAR